MPYTFRPATCADLPILREWLATPEVVRWWGEPAEQYALLEEALGDPLMVMRIVASSGDRSPMSRITMCTPGRSRISQTCRKARAASTRLSARRT